MKKLFSAILSTILLFSINSAKAQDNVLDGNPTLKAGDMITFQTYGGPDANAYYVPADVATNKVLIIFPDNSGLTGSAKRDAQGWNKLLDGQVAIYSIDLYDGKTAAAGFEASKLQANMDSVRVEAIVNGLLQKIGAGKQIATLGYGIGGTWAFVGSTLAGREAAGCVMYYAYPVKNEARIKAFSTDVLYLFANHDNTLTMQDMDAFSKQITGAGRGFTYETFNGAHGYADMGNPAYKNVPAKESFVYSMKFLKHKLAID